MELLQLARLFRRWWWLIALLAIAGGAGAFGFSQYQDPKYEAVTTLLVISGRPSRDALTSQELAARQQLAITYKELLLKRPVLEAVAAQLGIDMVGLDKRVKVDLVKDTAILKLSASAADPESAAILANTVVQAFILQEPALLANPYAAGQSGLSVVEAATPPELPVGGGALRSALLGALLGAMLAMGLVFAIDYFDTSIRSADDLALLTGLPTLAVIGRLKGRGEADKVVALHKPESAAADAYRMIRAQIEFASAERPLRTIVVTSARPLEGKSITAANLAVALAQTGLRVILIDANLRRPALHTLFGCPNTLGLSTAMQQIGSGRAADHLLRTDDNNLSLMLSGPPSPNPARLLAPERIGMLAMELRQHTDILVFDSPQCLDTVETSLLLRGCDAALLVVLARATKAEGLLKAFRLLQASQTHILGTVLNRAGDRREISSGYTFAPQTEARSDELDVEPPQAAAPQPGQAREVGGARERAARILALRERGSVDPQDRGVAPL